MYLFDFSAKLKRLNPSLFIGVNSQNRVDKDHSVMGLWLHAGQRYSRSSGLEQLDSDARRYMEDGESGAKPEFICGVPAGWVPEYDEYNVKDKRRLARGWRSVLVILTQKKLINIETARRVFSCPGLGTDEYDRIDFEERIRWQKGLRHAK